MPHHQMRPDVNELTDVGTRQTDKIRLARLNIFEKIELTEDGYHELRIPRTDPECPSEFELSGFDCIFLETVIDSTGLPLTHKCVSLAHYSRQGRTVVAESESSL